jgi:hypothetical protein
LEAATAGAKESGMKDKTKDPIIELIDIAENSDDKKLKNTAKKARVHMKKVNEAMDRIEKKLDNIETMQRFLNKAK